MAEFDGLVLRKGEFEQLMDGLLKEMQEVAEAEFLKALEKTGKELTGELKESFKKSVIEMATDLSGWVQFSFGKYGRFRDLKYIEYSNGWDKPNLKGVRYDKGNPYPEADLPDIVKAMIKFIGEKGLDKFKYIPGYKNRSFTPTKSRAVVRLAFTFAAFKLKKGRVRQKDTQFYSKSMGRILKEVGPIVSQKVAEMMLKNMVIGFENR